MSDCCAEVVAALGRRGTGVGFGGSAQAPGPGLPSGARGAGRAWNSLRADALRSDTHAQSVQEARWRARPAPLRALGDPQAPTPVPRHPRAGAVGLLEREGSPPTVTAVDGGPGGGAWRVPKGGGRWPGAQFSAHLVL